MRFPGNKGGSCGLALTAPPRSGDRYICVLSRSSKFAYDSLTHFGLTMLNHRALKAWVGTMNGGVALPSVALPPMAGKETGFIHAFFFTRDGTPAGQTENSVFFGIE